MPASCNATDSGYYFHRREGTMPCAACTAAHAAAELARADAKRVAAGLPPSPKKATAETPVPRHLLSAIPAPHHRVAADRAIRLAVEHGPAEAMEFADVLTPLELRYVVAILARRAASDVQPPLDTAPAWWTAQELEDAHRLWWTGVRTPWVVQGHTLFSRDRKRELRAARDAEAQAEQQSRERAGRVMGGRR